MNFLKFLQLFLQFRFLFTILKMLKFYVNVDTFDNFDNFWQFSCLTYVPASQAFLSSLIPNHHQCHNPNVNPTNLTKTRNRHFHSKVLIQIWGFNWILRFPDFWSVKFKPCCFNLVMLSKICKIGRCSFLRVADLHSIKDQVKGDNLINLWGY